VFVLAGISQVSAALYEVTFTGANIWAMSADNAGQARTDQAAPRRYRDWTQTNPVRATTYGLNGGVYVGPPDTIANGGFNAWAASPAGQSFAFDEINLWGKDGLAASWGEKYIANPDNANNGVTSWQVIQAPTGWTDGIVLGNQPYNTGPGAYPVWRSGTGAALSQANMNDPSFVFTFIVDISNPATAFEPDGTLKVWFGGFKDDLQMTGPDNYEVSGVMDLIATPVPEPTTMIAGALLLLPFGASTLRMFRKRQMA
jgi:hypothetical protein